MQLAQLDSHVGGGGLAFGPRFPPGWLASLLWTVLQAVLQAVRAGLQAGLRTSVISVVEDLMPTNTRPILNKC